METADQRVEREDLHLFINAGLTTTGQGGYYHGAEAERLSLAFLHRYIAWNYRSLYTLCLAVGLNDHNLAHALFTLLQSGAPRERSERERHNHIADGTRRHRRTISAPTGGRRGRAHAVGLLAGAA